MQNSKFGDLDARLEYDFPAELCTHNTHPKEVALEVQFHYTRGVNVDEILQRLNAENVEFILIGGMNFLLRHVPELTFDVDVWVKDNPENRARLNRALRSMGAEWGPTEKDWKPVPAEPHWLSSQSVFCLTTKHGALDIFRTVSGLETGFSACSVRAIPSKTAGGASFLALSDEDMLACQLALPPQYQKQRRIEVLRNAIARNRNKTA